MFSINNDIHLRRISVLEGVGVFSCCCFWINLKFLQFYMQQCLNVAVKSGSAMQHSQNKHCINIRLIIRNCDLLIVLRNSRSHVSKLSYSEHDKILGLYFDWFD